MRPRQRGPELYEVAKGLIPGGTQLFSKRPELFLPGQWPSYYKKARGVEVWDLDNRRYIDMSHNGIGCCILGAADPDVDDAVRSAINCGTMSTLNCPEEVELAELLCEIHPWADMVKYARTGGEAMAIAVRIARTRTKRSKIIFCGYHGWHDWYLANNLENVSNLNSHLLSGLAPRGVPDALKGTVYSFQYNQLDELKFLAKKHHREIAAVIIEPIRHIEPNPGFLQGVKDIATSINAVLIFDEITSGFRLTHGGAHLVLGIDPDIAVFGKAISNGYPMAAVLGKADIMQAAQETFISSTYWTERIGPTAAIATIRKHRQCHVAQHISKMGVLIREGITAAGEEFDIPIAISGIKPLVHFRFGCNHHLSLQTLYTQKMLLRGYLAGPGIYLTLCHSNDVILNFLRTLQDVFRELAKLNDEKEIMQELMGPVAHSDFRRLT